MTRERQISRLSLSHLATISAETRNFRELPAEAIRRDTELGARFVFHTRLPGKWDAHRRREKVCATLTLSHKFILGSELARRCWLVAWLVGRVQQPGAAERNVQTRRAR